MNMSYLKTSSRSIELLELGPNGNLQSRDNQEQDGTLENTLFSSFYPHGHVVRLSLRSIHKLGADAVLDVFSGVSWNGIDYLPVGSRKSLETQEIYFVDKLTHEAIACRFQGCMEALISQFDVLVSPCDVMAEQTDLRVLVLPNEIPGLNDWQGWIRRSVFSKFDLPAVSPRYAFVMAFGETQAKGEFALMDDAIADRNKADVIIPKKCLKPHSRSGFGQPSPSGKFLGRVVLGINQISREELLTGGISLNLLDEHVCQRGCTSISSRAMRHVVARAFQLREYEPNRGPSCTQI
jgi:hypothetical protein